MVQPHKAQNFADTLLILGDEETGIIVTKPDVLRDAANEIFGKMEK